MHHTAIYVFGASALFVLYVLFGYPVLLGLLSLRKSRAIRKEWMPRTVSVMMPVHNGEPWILDKLRTLADLNYPHDLIQIVVIDDGSTDRTAELVKQASPAGLELVSIPRSGKAAALNIALGRARGEILLFTDVRQRLDPQALRSLVACFADPSVGVVSGELIILSGETQQEADIGLYWSYEKWIRRRLSRRDSVLGATGCLYAMRRDLATPLPPTTLLDDVFLPLAAFFKGYRVLFEEAARAYDYPTALRSEFRRKVRTQAGVYQLLLFYPQLLWPTNRMWFHFGSHKLARLLLPVALLLMAASTLWLPGVWAWIMLTGQGAFYALAALDASVPAGSPLKRASSIARTFVVLVAAALWAPVFLASVGRQSGRWSTTEVRPAAVTSGADHRP
jgi:biofilm PGA synthesis N-glycosyltransferase PgaC